MSERHYLLHFRLGERQFAIRFAQIMRVVRSVDCTPLPNAPPLVLGLISVHGDIVPVFDMRQRFGMAGREIGLEDHFVVARARSRTVALAVESVDILACDQAQIITLARLASQDALFDGLIQLESGLTLIYDLDRLLSLEEEQILDRAMMEQPSHGG